MTTESVGGRRRRDAITIRDVASAAGVSTATVSRVIAGSRPVAPALATRVLTAAATLGYRPNIVARALSRGSIGHLGVVLPSLKNPYFYDIVDQLSRGADQAGYRLLVVDSHGDPETERQVVEELRGQTDGVFLLSPRMVTKDLRHLVASGVKLVTVNRVDPGADTVTVAVDNFRATLQLCRHLMELGHRNVVYLGGAGEAWQDLERWRAFEAARDLGLEVHRVLGDGEIDVPAGSIDELLATEATAIACFSDLAAVGLMGRLADRGLTVPEDLSIAGFDDIALARHVRPRLTTVTSPTAELGERAWARMVAQLDDAAEPNTELLQASLVVRESTGSPRTRL